MKIEIQKDKFVKITELNNEEALASDAVTLCNLSERIRNAYELRASLALTEYDAKILSNAIGFYLELIKKQNDEKD